MYDDNINEVQGDGDDDNTPPPLYKCDDVVHCCTYVEVKVTRSYGDGGSGGVCGGSMDMHCILLDKITPFPLHIIISINVCQKDVR